jgi:subtilase family serine protease
VQSAGYRTTPDVSLVADPNTGAWIADPSNLPASNPWQVVGGTSLSVPSWAGLIALVNEGPGLALVHAVSRSDAVCANQPAYTVRADLRADSSLARRIPRPFLPLAEVTG